MVHWWSKPINTLLRIQEAECEHTQFVEELNAADLDSIVDDLCLPRASFARAAKYIGIDCCKTRGNYIDDKPYLSEPITYEYSPEFPIQVLEDLAQPLLHDTEISSTINDRDDTKEEEHDDTQDDAAMIVDDEKNDEKEANSKDAFTDAEEDAEKYEDIVAILG
ncbi:hypothetical protein V6N13_009259 [Hibiscus sabdariffa]|uniref:Uncharacterized protein n=1 Tax=Hibiscus sabdariffa TaxID=183260 RepID=A0ABR2A3W1_9ROSI